MATDFETRVVEPLRLITGPLVGDGLLDELKCALMEERVFSLMFGKRGERIFVGVLPKL